MAETVYGERESEAGSGGRSAGRRSENGASSRACAVSGGAPKRQPARESAARTHARALPIVPVRARGLIIEGADGRRYLDCVSGAGTPVLGHNHPVVLEAIRKVLDSGAPLQVMNLITPVEDAFVTELLRTLPPGLADHARVRFCGPAGTGAATAVGLVRAATGRDRVITFADTHHGTGTGGFAAPGATAGARFVRLPYPRDHRRAFGAGGEHGAEPTALRVESALAVHRPEQALPAGLIVRPVHGEGGVVPASDAWLRRIRRITAERAVPLIADETETGAGRTGAFWAVEHSGIVPDVLVLPEAVGGSLPLAAVVHRDDLHVGDPGAGAFRGNQLALAAGAATLAHVRAHRLAEHARSLGARMLARLRGLAEEFPCVGDVRGRGLMIGIELVAADGEHGAAAGAQRPAAPETAVAVQRECLRRGLIVDRAGPCANVVRLVPPLTITEEQATAVLDRLADAVQAVAAAPPPGTGRAPSRGPGASR